MKQDIVDYLVKNQDHIKDITRQDVTGYNNYLKQEDNIWTSMINEGFISQIKSIIIDDVSINLGEDYESIMSVIEDINIEDYIK